MPVNRNVTRVRTERAVLKINRAQAASERAVPIALSRFGTYMLGETGKTFRALRHGGTYRGVTWPPYADQYTRKTDGTVVPAHGGVKKLRGRGNVKGRKRPSGRRITSSSNLLRDTGTLAAAAGTAWRFENKRHRLIMSTEGPAKTYAPKQARTRRFLFFVIPDDRKKFVEISNKIHRSEFRKGQ